MAKVICVLPNASDLINGIKFVEHKLGMISEEIEDDVAAAFAAIKGYKIASAKASGDKTPPAEPEKTKGDEGGKDPADEAETK